MPYKTSTIRRVVCVYYTYYYTLLSEWALGRGVGPARAGDWGLGGFD